MKAIAIDSEPRSIYTVLFATLWVLAVFSVLPTLCIDVKQTLSRSILMIGLVGLLLLLFDRGYLKKGMLSLIGTIGFFNTLSTLSQVPVLGFKFNASWFFQVFLWCGIIVIGFNAVSRGFSLKSLKPALLLIAFMALVHLLVGYAVSGYSGRTFLSVSWFMHESYHFVNRTGRFGFDKVGLVFLFHSLLILLWPWLERHWRFILAILAVSYPLILGSKTALLGLAVIGGCLLIYTRHTYAARIMTLLFILPATVSTLALFWVPISKFALMKGRYLAPVFSSTEFYKYPFGFGAGQYTHVARNNLLQVSLHHEPLLLMSKIHSGRYEGHAYGLYPAAESDILWFGVSFGWVFLALMLCFFSYLVFRYVIIQKSSKPENSTSAFLVIYFIASGLFQDHIQNQATLVVVTTALAYLMNCNSVSTTHRRPP